MDVTETKISIGELANGYKDDGKDNIVGYGGRLDIRPHYQRESVYDRAKQDAVIDSISKGFPISIMYWSVRDDGEFEILDGQQRTIAICEYIVGNNSFKEQYFDRENPSKREQEILNYPLTVYVCDGEFEGKMEWFRTVNIAGEKLKDQEIRNAVYAGRWVSDARRWFSKNNCFAYRDGRGYLNGSCLRQAFLETAIKWCVGSKNDADIREFMAKHAQRIKKAPHTKDPAKHLYDHFKKVIDWTKATFPKYRKEMKGLDWGRLYHAHGKRNLNPDELEKEIKRLMQDEEIRRKQGIYEFVLTRQEKHLSLRAFTDSQKRTAYEKQKGICPKCNKKFKIEEMEADHRTPWHEGGKTIPENCQMLCKDDNRAKGGK